MKFLRAVPVREEEGKMRHHASATTRLVLLTACAALLFAARPIPALEAVGTIRSVDAEKRVLRVHANGQERTVPIAPDVQILGTDGKPLAEGLGSKELKEGAEVTIIVDRGDAGPVVRTIRLGRAAVGPRPAEGGKPSVGLKPLTEMTAEDRYKGEDGGLYGGGRNEPPDAHREAAEKQTRRIVPLDADGKPAQDGRIGLVSISMSNATMEFSLFKQIADRDPRKSPRVAIVDCAQGGQAMAQWVDPAGRAWTEADRRLAVAGVGPRQVQVIWVKLANMGPRGDLAEHGRKLQGDAAGVLQGERPRPHVVFWRKRSDRSRRRPRPGRLPVLSSHTAPSRGCRPIALPRPQTTPIPESATFGYPL